MERSTETRDTKGPALRVLDVCLSAAIYWYLTGLLAALGFSLGFYFLKPAEGAAGFDRDFLGAFTWMDGKWYKQIATEGYRYTPDSRSNVAFFPAYPLLARSMIWLTGLRAEAALLLASNLSLLAALAFLMLYVRARYPETTSAVADYAVLAAALFPTGCFFRFAYSESTFLLLAVLAMYGMLRRWPIWVIALAVGLATVARPVGVALLLPLAIHILRRDRGRRERKAPASTEDSSAASQRGRATESRKPMRHLGRSRFASVWPRLAVYLPLACWGLVGFMAYQQYALGDPFAVFKAHGRWHIRADAPWSTKAASLATLRAVASVYDHSSPTFWMAADRHGIPWFSLQFANPIIFLGALVLVLLGAWRRCLSLEEVSLASGMLLISYVGRAYEMGMGSMGRFASVAFPVYLVLGHLAVSLPGALRAALFTLSGFFLATYTALYAAGYVIF